MGACNVSAYICSFEINYVYNMPCKFLCKDLLFVWRPLGGFNYIALSVYLLRIFYYIKRK